MKQVLKYPLSPTATVQIELPIRGAKTLHVGLDEKGIPCIWIEVPTGNQPLSVRAFNVFGTGWEIGSNSTYIGTYHENEYVWHVYEVTPRVVGL